MKATAIWVVIVASAVVAFGLRGVAFGEDAKLPPSDEETKAAEAIAAEVEQDKALKDQERKIEAQKHFDAAKQASAAESYVIAIEELTAAVAADPGNESYKEALKNARIMQINAMLSQKKVAEAKSLCDEFLTDYPGNEAVARSRKQAVEQLQNPPVPEGEEGQIPPTPTEQVQPTAEQLVAEAQDSILKKDYNKAMDKLLEARQLSPFDVSINKKIKSLQLKLTQHQRAYYEALREELLTQVYEAWTIRPRRAVRGEGPVVEAAETKPSASRRELLKKLETIIPEVKFEDAKLTEVVDFLSREADVNIFIHPVVFQGGYSTPAPGVGLETTTRFPGGPTTVPGMPMTVPGAIPGAVTPSTYPSGTGAYPSTSAVPGVMPSAISPAMGETTSPMGTYIPPAGDVGIKLHLKNVPLKEVLKYVLQWQRLKYVIEDYAILIAPRDYVAPESLETHIFRLATTGIGIIERPELSIRPGGSLQGPTDASRGGPSTDYTTGLGPVEGGGPAPETIKDFLLQSGVAWPSYGLSGGSSITYIRTTGTLIITNSPTNMVLIKELVRLWDQPALQVEIEARFFEILHTRWFENSFELGMLSPLIFSQKAKGGPVPSGVRRSYQFEMHPERGTRYFPQLLPMEFPTPDADQILSIRGIMTEPDFQFVWHAIDQKDWSDLLSAPRVTTISGQQAQIEVVQELTYPTEYDTETINIGGGLGGQTDLISGEVFMVTPGNWEKRDVGIILNVTPTVSADGKMISLVLMPEVTDLVKWINYGNEIYPINQPIFESRNVTTSVYVNDGETIVLGGLITDKTTTYEDKVPLLGSIPFVGRFFRTAIETSSKANLIIFVTARLITATGIELSQQRAVTEEQARHLQKKLRERKEGVGEFAPGVGTTGIIE